MSKIVISQKIISIIIAVAIVGGAIFLLVARTPQNDVQDERIQVVTSFYPLSYIATMVGGNLVSVINLVPAGVEPHDFEPSPRNLVEIGNADILFYNGASFEPWVKKWERSTKARPMYAISMSLALMEQGVSLIENDGVVDPHFWLDPVIMKREVEIIRDMLVRADPSHKELFNNNALVFLSTLDMLDQRFRTGLSTCSLRDIVVLHDAFSYLAHQYNFTATSIEGISPEEEPSPKDLVRIINLVREKGVKHIFFETVASPKFSELIAREVGGSTLVLNPIESLTPNDVQFGEDYFSIMEKNLNNLRKAMVCN
ncbi:MAG: Periplasmic solute binding protein [Parcubacteria group bacterium GW2011_GWC1_42_11]|uniref:Periplasmic solute binding protein n=1 Tax=Candidatus Nomurabacteria bacterium GW2011_GWC2_42_20 TaxID=1618756 RepID=A0A0G1BM74_9BACT|nr:MAG: Periplasmic solute binding protein [Parcubacteria group bacterium GW2011_GWC1_42_11]KKS47371.1 MAG: Periplasmic solute binding protein [Candidatus Nomurabacteria bacterium GW2011_GWC2_42_20]KKT09328.1 MAG: Periplasmic solute binding protein [Candidatus Nomurabacteria bacterium GW2011_GWB1_43_20]TAN35816.1 MAG: ABC transporter substrate-binding protein [Patescibacteria group bacterium]HBH71583.1 ABC transporter substrate-binding protein [Candidatus Yonathbacteria bacterium]